MESTEESQQNEITALRSIYANDFLESPPPKAWKGAARLPEFIIRVTHPESQYASKVFFHLHVRLPRTYPTRACPVFTIQQPLNGFSNAHVQRLTGAIHSEAQKYLGTEMIFQIITYCQEWIATNVVPPIEVAGSLATQMDQRASEEERVKRQRAEAEAEQENERATQLAEQMTEEIRLNTQKKEEMQRLEKAKHRARKRGLSDATVVPLSGDALLESFGHDIEVNGIRFEAVKLFHGKKECLGMTYLAEPVCDDIHVTLPLELHVITFDNSYYTSNQGKKKLKQVETEIQRLICIRHTNLLSVFAVKLTTPGSTATTRLVVLQEKRPQLTLEDVLQECTSLRENRAVEYICQILSALHEIHSANLVHRGLHAACMYLTPRDTTSNSKLVKVGEVAYFKGLLDLHKSNSFGRVITPSAEMQFPEAWLPKDAVDSPLLYSRSRDLHSVGVILLQMLLGLDVMEQYPDVRAALNSSFLPVSLSQQAAAMLIPAKKATISCLSLLASLAEQSMHTSNTTRSVSKSDIKTPIPVQHIGSPDIGYFQHPSRTRPTSRWREDWEELELLGRGGFGSVVKARNKIDSRIYAVKKIKLRAQGDHRIFREVNALSRLSHRFIVRYYTTWLETSDLVTPSRSPSHSDTETEVVQSSSGATSGPRSKHLREEFTNPLSIDLDDLGSNSQSSFPSIHFTKSSSPTTTDDSGEDSDDVSDRNTDDESISRLAVADIHSSILRHSRPETPAAPVSRTLYIQMEFVERQTLKERIAEGLSEDEAWRLFQQVVDALAYMSSLGILHRDIKLTNIFIDGKGDCKVGDFGLATSSLAAVDPSDVSPHAGSVAADLTLEVGTTLYIAPEVLSRKGGKDHSKADLYSLGIVFFEMNFSFSTDSERIQVIEHLRRSDIVFPEGWEPHRTRQKEIITWLLQHDPAARPTALDLSRSSLLPSRLEDEYFKGALESMVNPDSPHYQTLLSSLFKQRPRPVRGFIYDADEVPEHAALYEIVKEKLADTFRLHGAVDMEPPLLMPVVNQSADEQGRALFLDRHGELVTLSNNVLVPFARLAARRNLRRIKRFHIGDVYRPNLAPGHPKVSKAAVCDIITPDVTLGPVAALAEMISIVNDCLNLFPGLASNYDICLSHSTIQETLMDRIPVDTRGYVIDVLKQSKSSASQKRAMFLKRGLLRSTVDELEVLIDIGDIEDILGRLEKVSPAALALISPHAKEIKKTIDYTKAAGVTKSVFFRPLMLSNQRQQFKDGVCFEVTRRNRRTDIIAGGGRYDHLISSFSPPMHKADSVCAIVLQIDLEKVAIALATFQSVSVNTFVKEQRSFGFWSPRRCDVYIVSYQAGYLHERLEVAALLWQNGISADIMYESGLTEDAQPEDHLELCEREGILFTVYPRPRAARRDHLALVIFKVRSVLKGTVNEVSRQDLVTWLHQQLAEQKRIDMSTSGANTVAEALPHVSQVPPMGKESSIVSDVQLLLPGDTKKQRKPTKQMFSDRAYDMSARVKSAIQTGMPMLAIDIPYNVLEVITRFAHTGLWLGDEEAWRTVISDNGVLSQYSTYLGLVREAALKRKAEGCEFLMLFTVRDEKVVLLTLS